MSFNFSDDCFDEMEDLEQIGIPDEIIVSNPSCDSQQSSSEEECEAWNPPKDIDFGTVQVNQKANAPLCDVCNDGTPTMLHCRACALAVHPNCYGISSGKAKEEWACDRCRFVATNGITDVNIVTCRICNLSKGAMKRTQLDWVHVYCVNISQQYEFDDKKLRNVSFVMSANRAEGQCYYCGKDCGECSSCEAKDTCKVICHPKCAQIQGIEFVEIEGKRMFYCEAHRAECGYTIEDTRKRQIKACFRSDQSPENEANYSTGNKFSVIACLAPIGDSIYDIQLPRKRERPIKEVPQYYVDRWYLVKHDPNDKPVELVVDGYKFKPMFSQMTKITLKGTKEQLEHDFTRFLREQTGMTDQFNIKMILKLRNWLGRNIIALGDIPEIVELNVEPVMKKVPMKKVRLQESEKK